MSKHRQKQEHYPKHKMSKCPPILANGVTAASSPIVALASVYFSLLLGRIHYDTQS